MSFPFDITDALKRGGEERIALLRFCVMSVTMEPVFVFLAGEYRLRPTRVAALALYDVFCAPEAPAKIRALALLPPRDLRLAAAIHVIRQQHDQIEAPAPSGEHSAVVITVPHRNLFDYVATALRDDRQGHYLGVGARFDPGLPPEHSLPGGEMNAGQRQFLEGIWKRVARPRLAAAGFWQISTIE